MLLYVIQLSGRGFVQEPLPTQSVLERASECHRAPLEHHRAVGLWDQAKASHLGVIQERKGICPRNHGDKQLSVGREIDNAVRDETIDRSIREWNLVDGRLEELHVGIGPALSRASALLRSLPYCLRS